MPALRAACASEWRYLRGHRWDLAFVTVVPVVMLVLLAWMFSAGAMRGLPIAVVDLDHSADSRQLLRMIDASPGVTISTQPLELEAAFAQIRTLEVFAVVAVPRDFSRRLHRGEALPLTLYYNASYMTPGQSAMRDVSDAVSAFNARALLEVVAQRSGPATLRPPPVSVQADILHNRGRSYALFLLPVVAAAVLLLVSALAMTVALGREVRDGRLSAWLGQRPFVAIVGKLLPYVLWFSALGMLMLLWVAYAHGRGIAGSMLMLLSGQLLMHLCTAALALLFVGVTRDMATSLSVVSLFVGTSLAFSGATFPVIDAPLFTRVWSMLLPLTAYLKLQMQQLLTGSPWQLSLTPLSSLLLIMLVAGGIGYWRLLAAREVPAEQG